MKARLHLNGQERLVISHTAVVEDDLPLYILTKVHTPESAWNYSSIVPVTATTDPLTWKPPWRKKDSPSSTHT